MKVNIVGKGVIPGINKLAPVYNQDLEKPQILRILNFKDFRVFGVGTGLITKNNIDAAFEASIDNAKKEAEEKKPVVEKKAPKKTKEEPKVVVTEIESTPAPIVEEEPKVEVPTVEETTETVEEAVEPVEVVEVEETTVDEEALPEITEEVVTEERVSTPKPSKKNKKKNRNND